MAAITQLYRYPVKGLNAQILQQIILKAGEAIPFDRSFALAHGTTEFDPKFPKHLPKTKFLMLMKNERLAALETVFDENTQKLVIYHQGKKQVEGFLNQQEGCLAIEQFFVDYLKNEIRGTPRLVQAIDHMFSDVDAKVLSFVNLASIRDLETVLNVKIDPLRFRANVYFDDLPAWEELKWENQTITIGTAKFEFLKPTQRCAATNVNPTTAVRDLNLPHTLVKTYGHPHMGVYLKVVEGGEIEVGQHF